MVEEVKAAMYARLDEIFNERKIPNTVDGIRELEYEMARVYIKQQKTNKELDNFTFHRIEIEDDKDTNTLNLGINVTKKDDK